MKHFYVGVDLHKETSWFHVIDQDGKLITSKSIPNQIWMLKEFFQEIPQPFSVAVESTYNWYFFVDLAREYSNNVFLANSYELKAFAKRNKKTDKIDAKLIADILRKGFLPIVHITEKSSRELKEILKLRLCLVRERSLIIHKTKALLDKLGLNATGDYTTTKGLDNITYSNLEDHYAYVIKSYINVLHYFNQQIREKNREIIERTKGDLDIENLISIAGIAHFSGALIKSEIDDITRFSSFNKLCAYAGLAPKVHQSANTLRHGGLNKNRCKNLQWILLETVIHYIKAYPSKRKKYEEISERKGHNVAKVAIARDMLKAIYVVLKNKRKYVADENYQTHAALVLQGV